MGFTNTVAQIYAYTAWTLPPLPHRKLLLLHPCVILQLDENVTVLHWMRFPQNEVLTHFVTPETETQNIKKFY